MDQRHHCHHCTGEAIASPKVYPRHTWGVKPDVTPIFGGNYFAPKTSCNLSHIMIVLLQINNRGVDDAVTKTNGRLVSTQ